MSSHVFVYGSLMRGLGNHYHLSHASFLGAAVTVPARFEMISMGAFPAVILVDDGIRIPGELYEVDADTLRSCDLLEGAPYFYRRELVPVDLDGSGFRYNAIIYVLSESYLERRGVDRSHCYQPVVPGGDWRAYYERNAP